MRKSMRTEERNMCPIRIAVLGTSQVGKSALTVRYLTKRFIGEYRSDTGRLCPDSVMPLDENTLSGIMYVYHL